MSGRVHWQRRDAVASLCLDRPEKHNAMTPAKARELAAACHAINDDDSVRCVVLHGAGSRAFCAGSDINALDEYPGAFEFRNRVEYATELRTIRKPVNEFRPGVTLIAYMAQVPIQTVIIESDSLYLGKGWPIWRTPSFPVVFRARLGQRFEPEVDHQGLLKRLENYFAAELSA